MKKLYEEINSLPEELDPEYEYYEVDEDIARIALCTLGSINWGKFRNPEDMRRACRILHRSLNNILDYQDFLSTQSYLSNQEIRPLGIGVTNLAYWHAKRGYKYGEADSLAEVKSWAEHQAFYLTESSVELAKERGACKHSYRTKYGKGIFPWEVRANGVNELTDFTPELGWEQLRKDMLQYGVRNATQMAIAPVESCQSWMNTLNFANGDRKNFHEMLEQDNTDWKSIEHTAEAGTAIKLNTPILINGAEGIEVVSEVVYNGIQLTSSIEFDDGSVMNFTDNHKLLVSRGVVKTWAYILDLTVGESIAQVDNKSLAIKSITRHNLKDHTWDISTPSHTYLLTNGCISHNSSVVIDSTNGIELPMSLISTKESKAGSFTQVVPEYNRLKHKYQLMWDQRDCEPYLKTSAVLGAYTDQSISTNTYYNPAHFPDRKVPITLIAKNLMNFYRWGGKTVYYSLISKAGSKALAEEAPVTTNYVIHDSEDDESCDACKL